MCERACAQNKVLLMIAMFLEGAGAVLYITGSPLGACLLVRAATTERSIFKCSTEHACLIEHAYRPHMPPSFDHARTHNVPSPSI